MERIRPENLNPASELGRQYANVMELQARVTASAGRRGALCADLRNVEAFLERATLDTCEPLDFAAGLAKSTLLRRAIETAERQAGQDADTVKRERECFGQVYQAYMRAVDDRNQALDKGDKQAFVRLEEHIIRLTCPRTTG